MVIGIITIPFAIAVAADRGATRCGRSARPSCATPTPARASAIGNVLWVLLCGWWLALAHIVAGIALCLTIIGIPLGLACFKLVPVSFWPLGSEIVSVEEAEAMRAGHVYY